MQETKLSILHNAVVQINMARGIQTLVISPCRKTGVLHLSSCTWVTCKLSIYIHRIYIVYAGIDRWKLRWNGRLKDSAFLPYSTNRFDNTSYIASKLPQHFVKALCQIQHSQVSRYFWRVCFIVECFRSIYLSFMRILFF